MKLKRTTVFVWTKNNIFVANEIHILFCSTIHIAAGPNLPLTILEQMLDNFEDVSRERIIILFLLSTRRKEEKCGIKSEFCYSELEMVKSLHSFAFANNNHQLITKPFWPKWKKQLNKRKKIKVRRSPTVIFIIFQFVEWLKRIKWNSVLSVHKHTYTHNLQKYNYIIAPHAQRAIVRKRCCAAIKWNSQEKRKKNVWIWIENIWKEMEMEWRVSRHNWILLSFLAIFPI